MDGDSIYVAGAAVATSVQGFIYRFNVNGNPDGAFVNGVVTGVTPNNQGISAVALQSSRIIIGGNFSLVYTNTRNGMAWLDKDTGAIDQVLRAAITNADVRALLIQPDGKILVAGQFTTVNGSGRCLTRLNSDGSHDNSFADLNGGGVVIGYSLALEPDGKILFGHSHGVARVNANGTVDATFGPLNADGLLGTRAVVAAAIAHSIDGHVLVGAAQVIVGNTERRGVARLFGSLPPPPVITQQPLTQSVEAGTNVTFSIMATGAPPITFQWRKNATAIKGETNSTLLLQDVDSTDAANYTVLASNQGGFVTSIVARLFVSFKTAPLTLVTNGAGVILPKLPAELEVGREFTIMAKPAAGNVFSNWLSGISPSEPQPISSALELTFVMQSNLVIVANFVPSPFIPAAGVYNGIFYDTNSPAHGNAGAFTASLDANGGLKGSVKVGTRTRKFTAAFSATRVATATIAATPTDPLFTLMLELDAVNGVMSGAVSNGNVAASLLAYRNPFSSKGNVAPTAGPYNSAFPGAEDAALAPAGDGFTALTVSTAGRVSGKGGLADGSALKILSATSRDAQVPIYVPLYSGRGSIFGWLTVTNGDLNDVAGTLWWTKPGSAGGLYPAGFTNQTETLGSRYVAPASGTPVLTLANGVTILSGGNLVTPLTNSITLGGDNKIVGDNELAVAISAPKGSVKGSFEDPSSGAKRALRGVALPKQNQARGFFLGPNQSGRLFVGEAP
jgi:uncharacterized delta-60 repeat protein